jgi:hypothetical protein
MEQALIKLRDGGSFDEFVKETFPIWKSVTRNLMRRWQTPVGVCEEDILQELLMNAWIYYPKFDPTREIPFGRFIIFNATADTKRWMHIQRNAYRRMDESPSRIPVPLSCFEDDQPGLNKTVAATQEGELGFILTLEKKLKAKPKFAKIFDILLSTGFDRKKAVHILMLEGKSTNGANKIVTSTLKELKSLWS